MNHDVWTISKGPVLTNRGALILLLRRQFRLRNYFHPRRIPWRIIGLTELLVRQRNIRGRFMPPCIDCKQKFTRRDGGQGGFQVRCPLCLHKRKHYDISKEELELLWISCGGVCMNCKLPNQSGKKLSIDHDHNTGKVRGLLCFKCNLGLGYFNDDPALLRKAAEYLERST